MASKIKVKRSSVLGKSPTTSDIEVGEIAINTRDSKMFSRDTNLGIFEIGANVSSSTIGTLKVGNSSPYTLPTTDGGANKILRTNGSGTLSFTGDYVKVANLQSYIANTNPRITALESSGTGGTFSGDVTVGDDIFLDSDSSVIHFGDDGDVTLTHVADTGLRLDDNMKMMFGTGNDLQIYHDGSNSVIADSGTGNLQLATSLFQVTNPGRSENIIYAAENAGVNLYYDNSKKLETFTDGVRVDGHFNPLTADGGGLGSASLEWSDLYLADGAAIYFGNDQDVVLTHVHNTGLRLSDGDKLLMGDSDDLSIYHDGSNSALTHSGTGDFYIQSDQFYFRSSSTSENMITGTVNAAVTLYHNANAKLATTSSGVSVTGSIVPTSADGGALGSTSLEWSDLYLADGAAIYFGNDQDVGLFHIADTGLMLPDNDKLLLGSSYDLQIYHDGSNSFIQDLGTGSLIISTNAGAINLQKDSSETMATFVPDGAVTLYYDNSAKLTTTSTGVDVTGTVTMDGGSTSADFSFGDDDKALFGAGNDLQLYHDGSNSYILENGTGNLIVKGNAGIYLRGTNDENMAVFLQDGASSLYYDNSAKLTTTSTGISLRTDQADLSYLLDTNNVTHGGSSIWRMITRNLANDGTTSVDFYKPNGGGFELRNNDTHASNYTNFYVGSSERVRITSAGDVGIGTTSPDEKLEVWGNAKIGDTSTAYLYLGDDLSTGVAKLEIGTGRSGSGYSYIDLVGDTTYTDYGLRIIRDNSGANAPTTINHRGTGTFTIKSTEAADILFQTTNASRMTIASGGNVGIGTTSPANILDVAPDTDVNARIGRTGLGYGTYSDYAWFSHVDRISAGNYALIQASNGWTALNSTSGQAIAFRHNNTDQMTLTAGKLGIGTTTPSETLELHRTSGKIGFGMNGDYGVRIGYFDDTGGVHGFHIDTKNAGTTVSESRFVVRADSGNVGIGTKSPTEELHIFAAAPTIKLEDSDNNLSGYINGDNGNVLLQSHNVNRDIIFGENAASGEFARIVGVGGKVGIGTSSPSEKLHVVDGGGSDAEMILETSTNSTGARIHLKSPNATGANYHTIGSMNASTANWRIGGTGTAGAIDFQVGSGYTQMMRVNSTGLGIGTTSVTAGFQLEVKANDTTTGGQVFINQAGTGDPGLRFSTAATSYMIGIDNSDSDTFKIDYGTTGVGAQTGISINTSGLIGIGTSSPGVELHISSAQPEVRLQDSDGTNQYGQMYQAGGVTYFLTRNNTSNGQYYWNLYDGTTLSTKMVMSTSGYLGIGTTTPTSPLTAHGYTSGVGVIYGNAGAASQHLMTLTDGVATNFSIVTNGSVLTLGSDAGSTQTALKSTGTERMRLDASGRVGIGTTAPGAELEIAGDYQPIIVNSTNSSGPKLIWEDNGTVRGYLGATSTQPVTFYNSSGTIIGAFDTSGNFKVQPTSSTQSIKVQSSGGGAEMEMRTEGGGLSTIGSTNNVPTAIQANSDEKMRVLQDGKVAINSSSPSAFLHVNGDYNTRAFQSVGTQTTVDATYYQNYIDHNTTFSGTAVPTADRISYGFHVDSDFSGTFAATATSGQRFYNRAAYIHSSASHSTGVLYENDGLLVQTLDQGTSSATVDRLYGILNYTYDYNDGAKTNNIAAINGAFKRAEATGTTSSMYGTNNYAYTYSGAGGTTTAYGSANYIAKYDSNTMTTGAALRGYISGDAGTISNGYGVFISNYFTGTMTNGWGIYTSGFAKESLGGNVGIKTTSPSYELHVVGDIYATGNVSAYSSAIAKDNIVTIPNALEIVDKLRGVSFDWKESGKKGIGMIYEEVKEVVPELTSSEKGSHGVTYQNTVAILIEAIKELKQEIDELKRNA